MSEKIIDEVMEMARDGKIKGSKYRTQAFFNDILELVAKEFQDDDDWKESRYTGNAVSEKILSLKIPTN